MLEANLSLRETGRPGLSRGAVEFESAAPQNRFAPVPACSPTECPFFETTSRNRQSRVRACCLPCKPSRGSACTFPRERRWSRSEDLWHESSELLLTEWNDARCREISAAVRWRWEAGIARRETHRRTEKCSRRYGPRCTDSRP